MCAYKVAIELSYKFTNIDERLIAVYQYIQNNHTWSDDWWYLWDKNKKIKDFILFHPSSWTPPVCTGTETIFLSIFFPVFISIVLSGYMYDRTHFIIAIACVAFQVRLNEINSSLQFCVYFCSCCCIWCTM